MSQHLRTVISEVNWIGQFTKQRLIDYKNISSADATRIYYFIDSELSPEHLHQDGERPYHKAMARQSMLDGATTALQRKGFTMPADTYNM